MRRFGYIFEGEGGYPAICERRPIPPHGAAWQRRRALGRRSRWSTFDQDHGGVRSVGYRFGDVAYSSDVVNLDEIGVRGAWQGLDVWIVDALRYRPHPTHAHLERTLEWIARVEPRRAILTNLHIDLDYRDLAAELPAGVEPAFDGLRLEHELGGGISVIRKPLKLGFLASGEGSSARAIVAAIQAGELAARGAPDGQQQPQRAGAGLRRASAAIAALCIPTQADPEAADARWPQALAAHGVELIVLSGYLRRLGPKTLARYARPDPQHPSGPLPEFGGHGMYGRRVHEAVMAAGVAESGVSIHLVDEEYDHGPVMARRAMPWSRGTRRRRWRRASRRRSRRFSWRRCGGSPGVNCSRAAEGVQARLPTRTCGYATLWTGIDLFVRTILLRPAGPLR